MPNKFMLRLRSLIRKPEMERELDEEVRFHLEREAEENVRRGMMPDEARRAALINFGGVEGVKEQCRDVRGVRVIEDFWQDVRYGARMLLKNPGFTIAAVLTLALGLGANTAIFSVVNAVLLSPLPFADPERLVSVTESVTLKGEQSTNSISYPNFFDWREQTRAFEAMAIYQYKSLTLSGNDAPPAALTGMVASADLFRVLGVRPAFGRDFSTAEEKPAGVRGAYPVVLSHSVWRQRFAADADIIGRPLTLSGKPFVVVGVMPADFRFPLGGGAPADLWVTTAVDAVATGDDRPPTEKRGWHSLRGVARLKPGVTLPQAQAELDAVAAGLARQYPDTNRNAGALLKPLRESLVGDYRTTLLALLGAVACVLLLACANVANLLLARGAARRKEMSVRTALGASRARVVRQLLAESLLTAGLGGALGLLLAHLATGLLTSLIPAEIPRVGEVALGNKVLAFSLLMTLLTGFVFGLFPALAASQVNLTEALNEAARGSTAGGKRTSLRDVIVVTEVALAALLLIPAGLLTHSLIRLQSVDPGFTVGGALTARIGLPEGRYTKPQQAAIFFEQLIEQAGRLPGVAATGASSSLPLSGDQFAVGFEVQGRPAPEGKIQAAEFRVITPGYLRAMEIPVIRGRDVDSRDQAQSAPVIIINETLARLYFPGEDPVGRFINPGPGFTSDGGASPLREIVGVVRDTRWRGLDREISPEIYVPHAQLPFFGQVPFKMALVVRTAGEPQSLAKIIAAEVRSLDKDLPVINLKTLEAYYGEVIARPRFNALLVLLFAGAALALTAIGLYGVLSYAVSSRTREIGVRMALGARGRDVLALVVGQGMRLALIGLAAGLAGAFVAARLLESMLYGVSGGDPVTFAGVSALLIAVCGLACVVPAIRAARVDPLTALRAE